MSEKNKRDILDFLKEIQTFHSSKTNYDSDSRDPESRFMNDKKGVYCYNYNYQVATDPKNQMIMYNTVNIQNNYGQLINMIESSIMSLEIKPEFFTVDNGYYTDKELDYCFKHDIKIILFAGIIIAIFLLILPKNLIGFYIGLLFLFPIYLITLMIIKGFTADDLNILMKIENKLPFKLTIIKKMIIKGTEVNFNEYRK